MNLSHIEHRANELAWKYSVPGAQLTIIQGQTGLIDTFEIGEGIANSGVVVTSATKFPLGSITKAFTAALVMILVADGDLDLDAPVGPNLPRRFGERCTPLNDAITLRMLLSHTAGFMSDHETAEASGVSTSRILLECCDHELDYEPGQEFSYSNIGCLMVGEVVKSVTGMGWREAIESILLRPLGTEPGFITEPAHADDVPSVSGHAVNLNSGTTRQVEQALTAAEASVGALALSATDLLRFGLMLMEDSPSTSPLPRSAAEQMRTAVAPVPFGLANAWGAGLAAFDTDGTRWWGHDGTADGAACFLRVSPRDNIVVAFTSNANTGLNMWEGLVAELQREGIAIPSHSYSSPRGNYTSKPGPESSIGSYFNGDSEYEVVRDRNGRTLLTLDGKPHSELIFFEDLHFTTHPIVMQRPTMLGRFHRHPVTGEINRMHLAGRLAVRR